jgi:hypothetical protein
VPGYVEGLFTDAAIDSGSLDTGFVVQLVPLRLAILEQECSTTRQHIRCPGAAVVVGSE